MTVYEMIQELTQYDADQEVEINVIADGYTVSVTTDEQGEEYEEFESDVDFDEDVTDFEIDDYNYWKGGRRVRITATLE